MSDKQPEMNINDMDQNKRNNYYSRMAMTYGDLKYKIGIFEAEAAAVFAAMQNFNKLVVDNPIKQEEPKAEVVQ